MPNLPSSPRGSVPPIEDAAYEVLLAGNLSPADAPRGMRPLAEAIAALTVAPSARELAGEPDARAAYRGGYARPARARCAGDLGVEARTAGARRAGHRRVRLLVSVFRMRLAAGAAVAAAVTAGGLTAAAYAGVLPAPVQDFAHHALGAPAPHLDTPAGQPVAPSGPAPAPPGAAYGLCHAYEQATANGSGREKAAAFRKLEAAAGGAGRVRAYCAAAAHPGKTPPGHQAGHHRGQPTAASAPTRGGHGAGKPAAHPSYPSHPVRQPSHPVRKPGRRPSYPPASHPTGKPGRAGRLTAGRVM